MRKPVNASWARQGRALGRTPEGRTIPLDESESLVSEKLQQSTDHLGAVWDERARQDAQYFIMSDLTDQSQESFLRSGVRDVERFVDPWLTQLPKTGRALDIGCGVGRLTRPLADRFNAVVGVDISQRMIDGARALDPAAPGNVSFEKVPGSGALPFPDSSFDFVFSYIVFQHLPLAEMVETYLVECARVLVPGGVVRVQLNTQQKPFWKRLKIRVAESERVPLIHRKLRVRLDPHSFMGVVLTEAECEAIARRAKLEILELGPLGEQYTWMTLRAEALSGC